MNRQALMVAVVGVVSGGIGSAMVAGFSTRAVASTPQAVGKPYIVQVAVAPAPFDIPNGGVQVAMGGILYRTWSDGSVDVVAYYAKPPVQSPGNPSWSFLCGESVMTPAQLCLAPLGFIPPNLNSPADVNNDGIVDGADMGIVLGEWDGAAARE